MFTIEGEHLECVKYLHIHDCPIDEKAILKVFYHKKIDIIIQNLIY